MKKILLIVLGLLILARLFAPKIDTVTMVEENFTLPEFSLDTIKNGENFTSDDLQKGTLLLSFMSYNCVYCAEQSKYFSNNSFPLPIYIVSVDFDKEGVEKWLEKKKITHYYQKFGVLGNELGKKLNLNSVPVSFIVKDGVVKQKILGIIDDNRMKQINFNL